MYKKNKQKGFAPIIIILIIIILGVVGYFAYENSIPKELSDILAKVERITGSEAPYNGWGWEYKNGLSIQLPGFSSSFSYNQGFDFGTLTRRKDKYISALLRIGFSKNTDNSDSISFDPTDKLDTEAFEKGDIKCKVSWAYDPNMYSSNKYVYQLNLFCGRLNKIVADRYDAIIPVELAASGNKKIERIGIIKWNDQFEEGVMSSGGGSGWGWLVKNYSGKWEDIPTYSGVSCESIYKNYQVPTEFQHALTNRTCLIK